MVRLAGLFLGVGSVAGQVWTAARSEARIRGANDAALAGEAARYLAVVTPNNPSTGFDARRLVSGANTVPGSSFWPGGFQLALGRAPVMPDQVGLLPLPDSVTARLAAGGSAMVATRTGERVALVPFEGQPGEAAAGWAAAWNTLPERLHSWPTIAAICLALGGCGWTLLARHRRAAGVVAFTFLLLLTLTLGLSVRRTAVASTRLRLITARRLIELAATAPGVPRARLPEIGIGIEARDTGQSDFPRDSLVVERGALGPMAWTVAPTPRTQDGLTLRLTPVEAGLGGLWFTLLAWLALGVIGLFIAGEPAGLSGPGGLFHSAGMHGPRLDEGHGTT